MSWPGRLKWLFVVVVGLSLVGCQASPPFRWRATPTPSLPDLVNQARTLQAERRYGEAVLRLEAAVLIEARNDPSPLLEIGRIYLTQRRWLLAEDAFNRALATAPQNVQATAGLAEAVFGQRDFLRARRLWRVALDLDPARAPSWTGLGLTHLERGEFGQAEAAFRQGVWRGPDPAAQWNLAILLLPQEGPAATALLQDVVANGPADLLARRDHLLAALSTLPSNAGPAQVSRVLGLALVQWEAWPAAVHALTIATELDPENVEAWAFLGHALGQWGRPALAALDHAANLAPDSSLPLYFKGIYFRDKSQPGLALDTLLQATKLDPENAALTVEVALTLAEQGDYLSAEAWYIAATLLEPENSEFQFLLARFYVDRGYRIDSAGLEAAQRAVELDPDNAEAHDTLGWAQVLAGSPATGETTLRAALALDPDLVSAHYHLAKALEAQGSFDGAIQTYLRVIDLDLGGGYRERALAELQP